MEDKLSFRKLFEEARQYEDYWTEGLALEFTEQISRLMKEKNVSRSVLAERIGHSPAYITKVLRGDANLTIATMVKLARALGAEVRLHLSPAGSRTTWYDQPAEPAHEVVSEEEEPQALRKAR